MTPQCAKGNLASHDWGGDCYPCCDVITGGVDPWHSLCNAGVFPLQARKNELAIEDMDGGTFTISNGGVFGSLFGTPIINPPQSAILGMHGIFDRPVAVSGKVSTTGQGMSDVIMGEIGAML